MPSRDQYLKAAYRENTHKSYRAAINHYEIEWGGLLPATADCVSRYLADHAETHSVNTLKLRLAALSKWHTEQGFPDPTKAPLVRNTLKGIRALHPAVVKQAKPLQIEELKRLDSWLSEQIRKAATQHNHTLLMQHTRNRALLLLGFWRGFRSDELANLEVENVRLVPGEGMSLFIVSSKGDRENSGRTYRAPALTQLCPVSASQEWLALLGRAKGPVFPKIDRWGTIHSQPMNPSSIIKLLRCFFNEAGLENSFQYSSHSLRRGFATWANGNGWDVKMLMEYVGWRDVKSALRYIDAAMPFSAMRIEE